MLGEVVSTLSPAARKKGVKLALELEPALSEIRGDPERLRQVFLNLVENAIKFTPAEGTVTLRACMAEGTTAPGATRRGSRCSRRPGPGSRSG